MKTCPNLKLCFWKPFQLKKIIFFLALKLISHLKSKTRDKNALKSFDADGKCSIYESALNNELRVYRILNSDSLKDVIETSALVMFQKSMEYGFEVVKLQFASKSSIKFRINATANFTQQTRSQLNFIECEKRLNGA